MLFSTVKAMMEDQMAIDTSENKIKVLVNVYEPLITIMKLKFDAACLKRDAYLDRALRLEAGYLREEVTLPNSDKSKSFIIDNLRKLRLKPLNLLLSMKTVELMNEVCKEKNVPRDAFINRFFLLLIASDTLIEVLFYKLFDKLASDNLLEDFKEGWDQWGSEGDWSYEMTKFFDKPNILDSIEACIEINPFWRLRDYFSSWGMKDFKMYSFPFKRNSLNNLSDEYKFLKTDNTLGFNTYMTDDEVCELEALEKSVNAKLEADRLLAFAKKEKQARLSKAKQARGEK
jgi:hypothetical protein